MDRTLENTPEGVTDGAGEGVKLVFLETFGCQMNDNDSERILGFLKKARYSPTEDPELADLIVLNTCSIRDKAEQKVYSMLGRFKDLKLRRPGLLISVGGCVAQQEGDRLLKRIPYLDLVFGPHNIHRLPDLVREIEGEGGRRERISATAFNDSIDPDEYGTILTDDGLKASVSVMRGCNNFCAYCIVPFTRGREVSRGAEEITAEVTTLAAGGVKEVNLLGQNVNSYGGGGAAFPELLRMVSAVDGIERVRFITSHPKDISTELIHLFGAEPKLCHHLHLPVQSGSDRVLEAMGRGYTAAAYLEKVDLIRELYPDMSITTDIIVGFPGETEDDFEATMELLGRVRYDNIFSFMYSPRPGTRASELPGQVDEAVRSARLQRLQAAQRAISAELGSALVGRAFDVLVEGPSKLDDGDVTGRTSCNRIVNFPGTPDLAGKVVEVEITTAYPNSFRGSLRGSH